MKDRIQRIEYIREALDAAEKDKSHYKDYRIKRWRGDPLFRKIIKLDADFLMFRVENSRTIRQQLRFLKENSTLSDNLFEDPESSLAQEAQEQILFQMVQATGRDFLDDLRLRGQDDPAIITFDGYLVNGNRRVSALKALGERYIDCVVLPSDAKPRDIYELEQDLQLSQDFREDYHWINELINIREGMKPPYEYTEVEQARSLRISQGELKSKLAVMDLVDAFLIWKKIPKQYDYTKLDDAEQVFNDLEKALKKLTDDIPKQQALREAVFNQIEARPDRGRLYSHVKDLIKNFDQAYPRAISELASENINEINEVYSAESDNSILGDILAGEELDTPDIFNDSERAPEVSKVLVEVVANIKAENKELKDTEAVYEAVSEALRELQGLVIDDDTAKLDGINNKLKQIIVSAEELMKQVKEVQG